MEWVLSTDRNRVSLGSSLNYRFLQDRTVPPPLDQKRERGALPKP